MKRTGRTPLLEGLPEHGLGLGHGALDCVDEHDCTVNRTHGTGDVATEVNVTGRIDHVDQVILTLILMHHRDVGCVNGDTPGLLLCIRVHEELLACKFFRDDTGT